MISLFTRSFRYYFGATDVADLGIKPSVRADMAMVLGYCAFCVWLLS